MRIHRIFMCVVGIIAFVNLFACSTTTNKVTPLAEMPDKSNPGAIYILPKTAVALKIPVNITTSMVKTGVNCQKEIESLFNEKIARATITLENIQLIKEPVPDIGHIYNIDLSTTFLKDTKKKLVFNESGMLVSADYSTKDKTLEFTVQVLESIAKIGNTLLTGGAANRFMAIPTQPQPQPCSGQTKTQIDQYKNLVLKKDNWIFGNNSAGVDHSLDVFKARLAAIESRIEDTKNDILAKEVTNITLICPIDDSILLHDGQHKLLPLFTDDIAQQRLAQLRATVLEKVGAAGIAKLESLEVIVKVNHEHPSQKVKGLVAEQKGERGLYYRMPGEVSLTLVQTKDGKIDKVLGDTFKVAVAQLGPVLSLPSKMKTTDAAFSMEFFTDTGGLKSLGVETKAIDMQQVEKLGNSGVALVSAIAASNNKINQLKQQKEELSLEMDIRELREGKRPTQ